jgi:putative transposase
MPRPRRHHVPGVPLHVIQRGNNRKPCFFTDTDYAVYLDKLREYAVQFSVAVHSFVLMTNHVHLLLTPTTNTGVSQLMQALGRYYVRYVNSNYQRTGTLWEGRYKDFLVESTRYLLLVSKYIELNPVRAYMVNHPVEYPWSSYQSNALGKDIKLLTPHEVYLALGSKQLDRLGNYRALFNREIPDFAVEQIRTAIKKSWVLGESEFKRDLEDKLGYALPPFPRGGDRKSQVHRSP